MLRNFHTWNGVPCRPARSWLKNTGGPSSRRIAAPAASTTGELSTIPSVVSERSSAALRSGVRPAAGRVTGVDGAGAGWGTEAMTAASAGDGRAGCVAVTASWTSATTRSRSRSVSASAARQAQPLLEQPGRHGATQAGGVGVERLEVHGLPDRPGLDAVGGEVGDDGVAVGARHGRVDGERAEPPDRLAGARVGHEVDTGQVGEGLAVGGVDGAPPVATRSSSWRSWLVPRAARRLLSR